MICQCANPRCGREFRYLHEGHIFVLEPELPFTWHEGQTSIDHYEVRRYWLCDDCARRMTLRRQSDGSVRLMPRPVGDTLRVKAA